MAGSSEGERTEELAGWTVGITAERRANQQIRYLASRGADTVWAPVLKTIDTADQPQLLDVARAVIDNPPDVLVVQTGQGLRWWLDALDPSVAEPMLGCLAASAEVWCRGSKAASAAKAAGLNVTWQAPNESAADIADRLSTVTLADRRLVVQLDGSDDYVLLDIAKARAADAVGLNV